MYIYIYLYTYVHVYTYRIHAPGSGRRFKKMIFWKPTAARPLRPP